MNIVSNSALLIVDMQKGMSMTEPASRNNPNAEKHMLALLSAWRGANSTVVHIRHISRAAGSPFWPGQTGAEFQDTFSPLPNEHVVEKNVTDAFINTGLERWLHVRGIGSLVIVGVSTNYSVESTARTAGNLGFKTYVVSDATFTFNRKNIDEVLVHAEAIHQIALANLRDEYATIVKVTDIL